MKSAESPPSLSQSSPPAVTEALDQLDGAAEDYYGDPRTVGAGIVYAAARSRLEQLFREQLEEIGRLTAQLDGCHNSRNFIEFELSSLKDSQLTRFEAETVLMSLERKPFKGPELDDRHDAGERAIEKLRSISSTPAPGNEK